MNRTKLFALLVCLFTTLLVASSAFAQEETTAEAATNGAPQGVDLGVFLIGALIVVGMGIYLAMSTRTPNRSS